MSSRVARSRAGLLVFALLLSLVAIAPPAAADWVRNDILLGNGQSSIAPGGSLVVLYYVEAASNDKQAGCNAADATPLTLSILPDAPGASASPATLTFTACGAPQPVLFTGHAPGNYRIDLQASDAGPGTYALGGGTFTLHVAAPEEPAPPADATPPVWTLDAPASAEAAGPGGAAVTYSAQASDPSGIASLACSPPSGSTFPLGTTTVACTATDGAGNVATASFAITVVDTTPPVIAAPADLTAEAAGPGGASVAYAPPAWTDAVDGAGLASCAPASGLFPLGATLVTCGAQDASGNAAAPVSFTITVSDTTAPAIAVPADITAEATGPDGADVSYAASASDAVGVAAFACAPPPGLFPLGATSVACSASDAAGNGASSGFTITVVDTTAPALHLPADITAEATGPDGAHVGYAANATDAVGVAAFACAPPPGAFPLGATSVACAASDAAGNSASGGFTVRVVDTTPPALALPGDIAREADALGGAHVAYAATALDIVDGALAPACDIPSGSLFPVGATLVTCAATDAAGNAASGSFTVTIADTTPPALSTPANLSADATSGSGAMVGFSASAYDIVDGALAVSCSHAPGSSFALGATTVTCSATDAAGNAASASFTVTVLLRCDGPLSPFKEGKTLFRQGATIPVKCRPAGGSAGVADAVIRITMRQVNGAAQTGDVTPGSTSAADTGNIMRWDPVAQQYVYNLATRELARGLWDLTLDFGGGATKTVKVGLR